MSDKNPFGGSNPHSLYVPITETEQEVLARLIEADDLEVVLHGWGVLHKPKILFGDLRISIQFTINFNAPAAPMPLYYLDLELRTRAGLCLFRERQPTVQGGQPLQVAAGVSVTMAWDIALSHIDPAIVKAIKPGAVGLTSRRLDRETGEATPEGNMRLDQGRRRLLAHMAEGERQMKASDTEKVVAATVAAGDEIVTTSRGIETR